ncbi:cation diffusion facilitator family transporter [Leptospira ilyithenensis]|uniref:Cation transporter n=1 Tax=Leptospira ilyithenensis TaxID=2484901 RepID=A0A4V3JXG6_9LEPT|nr:cation diffusion facilitator family transporter [Leptospira ilyithenensis]TGN14709.1 cation transporter [Leptospira ilyithenensis]
MGSHHHSHSGHSHNHHDHGKGEGAKNIALAFALNAGFTILEIVGGLLTNSMAVLSDGFHDLGDSLALGLAYVMEKKSGKRKTKNLTYGYKRFSILSAFVTSLILTLSAIVLSYFSFGKLWNPEPMEVNGVLGLAVLGFLVNGFGFLKLNATGGWNEKSVRLHLLEDVLGWALVLIMGVILKIVDWFWLDPLLSLGLNLFILSRSIPNLIQVGRIFLQYVPENLSVTDVENQIKTLDQSIVDVHDSRLWSLDGESHVYSGHIVIKSKLETLRYRMKNSIKSKLNEMGVTHVTLEFENLGEACKPQST